MSETQLPALLDDLGAEFAAVDTLVAAGDPARWARPTPAAGWDVVDQISHLAFFEERAAMAVADSASFTAEVARAAADLDGYMAEHLQRGRALGGEGTLAWWRRAREETLAAAGGLGGDERIPWYGPAMSPMAFFTARLMETWAHGTDVADALGRRLAPTDRLRHVAELGVRTFGWSFANRGLAVPEERVRVTLRSPDGERLWRWNEDGSGGSIAGPAEDFCRVVTQRRHVDDTDLVVTGEVARRWMAIAQCFAGPPGPGRPPRVDRGAGAAR